MLKMLEGFRHIAARRISGMIFRSTEGVEQEYPPVVDAMEDSGLWPIKEYIHIWQSAIVAQVACWPIYELCTGL